jgi:hypothetical protein
MERIDKNQIRKRKRIDKKTPFFFPLHLSLSSLASLPFSHLPYLERQYFMNSYLPGAICSECGDMKNIVSSFVWERALLISLFALLHI